MILFRYLVREVLLTLAAVSAVLLLIILGGRFIGLFQDVAEGSLSLDFLWTLLLLQFPSVLELILPLGFFLSVMLTYGRLYQENEIGVLMACGFSPNRLLAYTLFTGLLVASVVASFSLWLTPWSESKVVQILETQKQRVDFSTIKPGRFQEFSGRQVVYTEDLTDGNTKMKNVFLSQQVMGSDGESRTAVFKAEQGYQYLDEITGSRYLILENGARTEGRAGAGDFSLMTFERYAVRMTMSRERAPSYKVRQLPTAKLIGSPLLEHQSALQWRFSLPLMVLVVTLIAVPLSYVRPRQGRFAKLFPAVFLHILYLSALISVQGMIEKQQIPASIGLWAVHFIFISLAAYLLLKEPLATWIHSGRNAESKI